MYHVRPIAFEDSTRPEQRIAGTFVIEMGNPDGMVIAFDVSYSAACAKARRMTQYHEDITLLFLEPYKPQH